MKANTLKERPIQNAKGDFMLLMLGLICFFSCVGGILLGQSLKANYIFKLGLEKGQKKMFNAGVISVIAALVISLASLFFPGCRL